MKRNREDDEMDVMEISSSSSGKDNKNDVVSEAPRTTRGARRLAKQHNRRNEATLQAREAQSDAPNKKQKTSKATPTQTANAEDQPMNSICYRAGCRNASAIHCNHGACKICCPGPCAKHKLKQTIEAKNDELGDRSQLPRHGSKSKKEEPTTRISGKFLLILRQPEHLLAVFAQLTTTCILRFGKELIDKDGLPPLSCQVAITPGLFPPGEYELPFAFDIPCDYWGRSAIIDPDDRDDERDFGLIYTLDLHITRSLGQNRSDTILVQFPRKNDVDEAMSSHSDSWRNLYQHKFFSLVCSPVDPGELAPPLERAIEEFAPQLGPITLLLTSRTFTIGALVNFNINLPAVPPDCKLSEIRGSVQAQFTWTPFKSGKSWTDIPIKYPMFTLDGAKLEKDSVSGALSASTAARLPNDRIIGPSSVKHVRTPLTIAHHLLVEFDVLDETGHRKIITIREPVNIASCLLISEQINLPTYGSKPLPRSEFQPNRKNERHACACGFTIEQLMEREYEGIELEEHYEPPELKSAEERARSSNAGT